MKKVLAAVLACFMVVGVVASAAEKGGAGPAIISIFLPGVGEWMNSDYDSQFPIAECILGSFCFPFMISSVIDAARGDTSSDIRFDFWSNPNKK